MADAKKKAAKAPEPEETEEQGSPEAETGASRLLGGPTHDDLNPAYAPK